MLKNIKEACRNKCSSLGNLNLLSDTELANKYCEALDTKDRDALELYQAALLLKFWPYINFLYEKCKITGLIKDECFGILAERIDYACKYRSWQDPVKKCSARTAIVNSIKTEVKNQFYRSNLQKNLINHNQVSLDTPLNDSTRGEDHELTLGDTLSSDCHEQMQASATAIGLIQSYLNSNKIIEGVILDRIAFTNTYKINRKAIKKTLSDGKVIKQQTIQHKFSKSLLADEIEDINPSEYISYFSTKYRVDERYLKAALETVKKGSRQKINSYITRTLEDLKMTIGV